ncbi:Serine/threonine-protein kinase PAK 1 [Wallemia ichthyophaga EXF-994]|uniref:Serine/threonine-protein kinase PAK 1 n=1 Tax=Wallemia ichthyophaga (strain EXF-994 / CBS 113033) TaxID=1299270 RepID=R9ARP9_WALI9|nr:Serine/threonine-protein kinase PAK 1 [Wallemia ichthyophaga EXF-994]TIB00465.1 hypothetical protein E3P95_01679 [Wallemia ichthyophaga]EOR02741.1 Serine/threonine-protein kinase PAK 1 [Wallemia ichthyophaga EXF-994]TIB01652.1 hypothetical protein E3P94_01714 [Wallemia ichthyophaga]TIB34558.1 hypothetical protein E3P84_01757 [Wallemia ichthyophaga]TIB41747.1 hypothetical protein E3P83_01718 [Wallemia ichthyophaga]
MAERVKNRLKQKTQKKKDFDFSFNSHSHGDGDGDDDQGVNHGDDAITLPNKIEHLIHVDGHMSGLPPSWANQLAQLGYFGDLDTPAINQHKQRGSTQQRGQPKRHTDHTQHPGRSGHSGTTVHSRQSHLSIPQLNIADQDEDWSKGVLKALERSSLDDFKAAPSRRSSAVNVESGKSTQLHRRPATTDTNQPRYTVPRSFAAAQDQYLSNIAIRKEIDASHGINEPHAADVYGGMEEEILDSPRDVDDVGDVDVTHWAIPNSPSALSFQLSPLQIDNHTFELSESTTTPPLIPAHLRNSAKQVETRKRSRSSLIALDKSRHVSTLSTPGSVDGDGDGDNNITATYMHDMHAAPNLDDIVQDDSSSSSSDAIHGIGVIPGDGSRPSHAHSLSDDSTFSILDGVRGVDNFNDPDSPDNHGLGIDVYGLTRGAQSEINTLSALNASNASSTSNISSTSSTSTARVGAEESVADQPIAFDIPHAHQSNLQLNSTATTSNSKSPADLYKTLSQDTEADTKYALTHLVPLASTGSATDAYPPAQRTLIATGLSGDVYASGCGMRALKVVRRTTESTRLLNLQNELSIVRSVPHEAILPILELYVGETPPHATLVMPLMARSLTDILALMEHGLVLSGGQIARVVQDILSALAALHAHPDHILHRDVRSDTIMLASDGRSVLTDFASATRSPDEHGCSVGDVISAPFWLAPELCADGGRYTHKSDVWSLIATTHEMVTGLPPYAEYDELALFRKLAGGLPDLPNEACSSVSGFITRNAVVDPVARPSARQLLDNDPLVGHDSQANVANREDIASLLVLANQLESEPTS